MEIFLSVVGGFILGQIVNLTTPFIQNIMSSLNTKYKTWNGRRRFEIANLVHDAFDAGVLAPMMIAAAVQVLIFYIALFSTGIIFWLTLLTAVPNGLIGAYASFSSKFDLIQQILISSAAFGAGLIFGAVVDFPIRKQWLFIQYGRAFSRQRVRDMLEARFADATNEAKSPGTHPT